MNSNLWSQDDSHRAPQDIVPPSGLTRETLRRMNDAKGTVVEGTIPGEVMLDIDGLPVAVTESRKVRSFFGGCVISRADADRLGVTPDEFPNIKVL